MSAPADGGPQGSGAPATTPDAPGPPAADETHEVPQSPFRGLLPYTEDDARFFFGRDGDADLIIANLMASRLTVLYGPSGVGKSSVLRAGVVRRLRELSTDSFSFLAVGQAVVVYQSRWTVDPLAALGAALRGALPPDAGGGDVPASDGPLSVELLRQVVDRHDTDVYLICDQFEEFTLYQQGEAAQAFAAELGRIVATPALPVSVLISIREDALATLDRFSAQLPGILDHRLRLDHLGPAAAREAIERPVLEYDRLVGGDAALTVQPELVDRLLEELSSGRVRVSDAGRGAAPRARGSIETPYLQLVMTRLWSEELARGSHQLRAGTLTDLGGAEGIVRSHLGAVLGGLSDRQREVAAAVLRYLVTPSGTKIAQSLETLAYFAELSDPGELDELREVLEALSDGERRILRPVPSPVDEPGPPLFEVFHDVLAPAILDWQRRYVLTQERREAEADLVRAKEAAEERQRAGRRQLRITQLVAVVAVLLLISGALAVAARRAGDDARSRAQLSRYERLSTIDPVGALHLALTAYRTRRTPETERVVRDALDADVGRHEYLRAGVPGVDPHVAGAQYAPDGASMVTAGRDGHAKIFDVGSGTLRRDLGPRPGEPASPLTAAVFDATGTWVLTAATNGRVRVLDAATGAERAVLGAYRGPVTVQWDPAHPAGRVLVSLRGPAPDGQQEAALYEVDAPQQPVARFGGTGATAGAYEASLGATGTVAVTHDGQGTITVWDASTGQPKASTKPVGPSSASPVLVQSDDSKVAFLAQPGLRKLAWTVGLWDWRKPNQAPVVSSIGGLAHTALVVSHDRRSVAVGLDGRARVYSAADGATVGVTPPQDAVINDVDLSSDGTWLATASEDGTARLWVTSVGDNRSPMAQWLGHTGPLATVRFGPTGGDTVLTAGADGVRSWHARTATSLVSSHYGWMLDGDVSHDGAHLLTASQYGYLDVWSTAGGRPLAEYALPAASGFLTHAGFALDDRYLVAVTSRLTAPLLMPWPDRADPVSLAPGTAPLTAMAVSPNGRQVAAGTTSGQVVVWDLASRQIVRTATVPGGRATALLYVPHTSALAVAGADGAIRLWDLDRQSARSTLSRPGGAAVTSMAVSADGSRLAAAAKDRTVTVWRLPDGVAEQTIDTAYGVLGGVGLSTDGEQLAVGAGDAGAHVYRVADGEELGAVRRHGDSVTTVRFLGTDQLLTLSDDGTAAVSDCLPCRPFEQVLTEATTRDREGGT